jgi:hypothetical protein
MSVLSTTYTSQSTNGNVSISVKNLRQDKNTNKSMYSSLESLKKGNDFNKLHNYVLMNSL